MSRAWKSLSVVPAELRLAVTLLNGQAFSWRRSGAATDEYVGVIGRHVFKLREDAKDCSWQRVHPPAENASDEEQAERQLRSFLNLGAAGLPSLSTLYADWSARDPDRFGRLATPFQGVRLLRQEPWECLVSFVCSSNNHIPRITSMLQSLRQRYGDKLCTVDGVDFFSFPDVERVADIKEQELRDLGFGYRAAYVTKTAAQVKAKGGEAALLKCRTMPRYPLTTCVSVAAGRQA